MNYQHAFHAGTVADVFKHSVLIQILKCLQKKETPFCYLETHAGQAVYALHDLPSQKTGEYKRGILPLWQQPAHHPLIVEYLNVVKAINSNASVLSCYPGSSLFAHAYLRAQDEAILCELNEPVYQALSQYFKRDRQMHVHFRDGYEMLGALLPPKQNRGLLLIDPPYEVENEYQLILAALKKTQHVWRNGIYMIWFPIKRYQLITNFYEAVKKLGFEKILAAEFWETRDTPDGNHLRGSGLLIINPPWQLDETIRSLIPALIKALQINEVRPPAECVKWL